MFCFVCYVCILLVVSIMKTSEDQKLVWALSKGPLSVFLKGLRGGIRWEKPVDVQQALCSENLMYPKQPCVLEASSKRMSSIKSHPPRIKKIATSAVNDRRGIERWDAR